MKRIPIKGMAKGFVTSLSCGEAMHHKIFLRTEGPARIQAQGIQAAMSTMHALNQNNVLGDSPSDETIRRIVLITLKRFVQEIGNKSDLRKVPSEQDLEDTVDMLIKQLNKHRNNQIIIKYDVSKKK